MGSSPIAPYPVTAMQSTTAQTIAQSPAVQSLYNQYFNSGVCITDADLEAFNDAIYAICGDFDLFEQVCMQLNIA